MELTNEDILYFYKNYSHLELKDYNHIKGDITLDCPDTIKDFREILKEISKNKGYIESCTFDEDISLESYDEQLKNGTINKLSETTSLYNYRLRGSKNYCIRIGRIIMYNQQLGGKKILLQKFDENIEKNLAEHIKKDRIALKCTKSIENN
jgi:hypothetical protein